ncbi:hypothetical protein E7744_04425 [Citricoccus sp. SGAir0253]|uniref:hypothetical protein n=1 Tax=Citricoccus sp. SGAir0253 TaxID=2567881 RepID=UPI0010CD5C36|nr:hypothetical protein [Citricoccus sp. SGAir0253]QCU77548.1 hypothetical protein E7744_04425 [Citricoccus sp. SGAir0253]
MLVADDGGPVTRQPRGWRFRASVVVGVIVYAMVLEYAYVTFIAPKFGYLRYYYVEPDRVLMWLGLCAHIVTAWTFNARWQRPSDVMAWLTLSFVVLPIGVVPFFSGALKSSEALAWSLGSAFVLLVMNWLWSIRAPDVIPVVRRGSLMLWAVVFGFTAVTYTSMAFTVGLTIDIHSLLSVYDVRDEYKSALTAASPIVGYLVSNQGYVINPLLMSIGALKKNIPLVLIGILGQLLIYSETGFKTIFLSVPVAIALGLMLKGKTQPRSTLFFHAVNLVAIASVVIDSIRDVSVVQIFVNRLMITSGYLTAIYADFYSEAPKHLWSYSFLSGITTSPYDAPPSIYLGQKYFGFEELNVNANLFADGFANLGVAGIAIEALVLVGAVILLNMTARGLPISLISGTLLLPVIALANGSPITALFSYGLLLSALVFALVPRDDFQGFRPDHIREPDDHVPAGAPRLRFRQSLQAHPTYRR